jgi:hypothetical protein
MINNWIQVKDRCGWEILFRFITWISFSSFKNVCVYIIFYCWHTLAWENHSLTQNVQNLKKRCMIKFHESHLCLATYNIFIFTNGSVLILMLELVLPSSSALGCKTYETTRDIWLCTWLKWATESNGVEKIPTNEVASCYGRSINMSKLER